MGIANINSNKRGLLETQAAQFPKLKVSVKRQKRLDYIYHKGWYTLSENISLFYIIFIEIYLTDNIV